MIAVSELAKRVGDLMLDEEHIRWPLAELIRWGNECMAAILTRRPQAFARTSVVPLVAGTRQSIPADGSMLLDVVRNIAADGVTSGKAIRRTDRQLLDDALLDWHTSRPKTTFKHYTYDDRNPTEFYVYPPVTAGVKVELCDAALPVMVAEDDTDGEFAIRAEYSEAVVNYLCYRCHSKDSEFANGSVAAAFYQAFEAALGIKTQAQAAASPNQPTNSV